MTWDSALDQKKITLVIDTHDFQVLDRAANVAHLAGHFLALEYASGRLVLAN